MKGRWSQDLQLWLRKGLNTAAPKKVDFWVFANHPAVHIGGVRRGRVRGCGRWLQWHETGDRWQVSGDTWQVICDMWPMTCDMLHVTRDTWHVTPKMWHLREEETNYKMFCIFCIGATILTCWEIQCLLYAGFLSSCSNFFQGFPEIICSSYI